MTVFVNDMPDLSLAERFAFNMAWASGYHVQLEHSTGKYYIVKPNGDWDADRYTFPKLAWAAAADMAFPPKPQPRKWHDD